jgi:hypothetical protein
MNSVQQIVVLLNRIDLKMGSFGFASFFGQDDLSKSAPSSNVLVAAGSENSVAKLLKVDIVLRTGKRRS